MSTSIHSEKHRSLAILALHYHSEGETLADAVVKVCAKYNAQTEASKVLHACHRIGSPWELETA